MATSFSAIDSFHIEVAEDDKFEKVLIQDFTGFSADARSITLKNTSLLHPLWKVVLFARVRVKPINDGLAGRW